MKKKLGIGICVVIFLLCAVATSLQNQSYQAAIKPVEITDIPVTYQLTNTQFYYDKLTLMETKIYEKINELLRQYKSGDIVLDQPIDVKSYFHLESSLRYDYNNFWYLAYLLPYGKDDERIFAAEEKNIEEKKINKMVLMVDSKKFQDEIVPLSEEDVNAVKEGLANETSPSNTYHNFKDSVDYFVDDNSSYYNEVNAEIESNLQQTISNIPKGINQESAVQYFSQWLVDNMFYDSIIGNNIITGDLIGYDLRREISAGSLRSINNKEGTCTGFSLILTTLCNRVGIDAYVVLGEALGGRHGWVAIKIGDETYYKDPTSEIADNKVQPLATKVQFYKYFHKDFKPFLDIFDY